MIEWSRTIKKNGPFLKLLIFSAKEKTKKIAFDRIVFNDHFAVIEEKKTAKINRKFYKPFFDSNDKTFLLYQKSVSKFELWYALFCKHTIFPATDFSRESIDKKHGVSCLILSEEGIWYHLLDNLVKLNESFFRNRFLFSKCVLSEVFSWYAKQIFFFGLITHKLNSTKPLEEVFEMQKRIFKLSDSSALYILHACDIVT